MQRCQHGDDMQIWETVCYCNQGRPYLVGAQEAVRRGAKLLPQSVPAEALRRVCKSVVQRDYPDGHHHLQNQHMTFRLQHRPMHDAATSRG